MENKTVAAQEQTNKPADGESVFNEGLAVNYGYPPGYHPDARELESDARMAAFWVSAEIEKSNTQRGKEWLAEHEAEGMVMLLCDEISYRISESEKVSATAISKAMANVKVRGDASRRPS